MVARARMSLPDRPDRELPATALLCCHGSGAHTRGFAPRELMRDANRPGANAHTIVRRSKTCFPRGRLRTHALCDVGTLSRTLT